MTKLSMLWRKYFEAKSESEKEAILKKICPGITSEGLEMMKRKMPVQEERQQPTWDDFLNATERQEKEAILQEMYDGTLTPEELEAFFPKD